MFSLHIIKSNILTNSFIFLQIIIFYSCNNDFLQDNSEIGSSEIRFSITSDRYQLNVEQDSSSSMIKPKGSTGTLFPSGAISKIYYYIVDNNLQNIQNIRSGVATDLSYIRVEGLKNGTYQLFVLAESEYSENTGEVNNLNGNFNATWLQTTTPEKPIGQEYYYTKHVFQIENGIVSNSTVNLERLVGRVQFDINFNGYFAAEGGIKKITVRFTEGNVYSMVNGLGTFLGNQPLSEIDITKDYGFFSLPTLDGKKLKGTISITAGRVDPTEEEVVKVYSFTTSVAANGLSMININYEHPDDSNGLLYIRHQHYTNLTSNHILTDTEPKSIYYNTSERFFRVNQPIQAYIDNENLFHIKFYSAIGVANVRISVVEGASEWEFAHFDTIPPFFEAKFEHPMSKKSLYYKTSTGKYIFKPMVTNLKSLNFNYKWESEDPYLKKIKRIVPSWKVMFGAYGGDPDAPNGAPKGNWMGLRPVHAREACVFLTNAAYMFSLPEFNDAVVAKQGEFYGNGGTTDILDNTKIVQRYQNLSQFIVGLVYTGNGTVGLGGGDTWGVAQYVFFGHYDGGWNGEVCFHELGHCAGFSHSSGMTYGPFAPWCSEYYVNLARNNELPISSKSALNSSNNPYRY